MKRRTLLAVFLAAPLVLPTVSRASNRTCCPLCAGALIPYASLEYDKYPDLERRNAHARGYIFASQICTRCSLVYSEQQDTWSQKSARLSAFVEPIDRVILEFPLPPAADMHSMLSYSQEYRGVNADKGRTDSIDFWLVDNDAYFTRIRNYAADHSIGADLALRFYTAPSQPGRTYLTATAKAPFASRYDETCSTRARRPRRERVPGWTDIRLSKAPPSRE